MIIIQHLIFSYKNIKQISTFLIKMQFSNSKTHTMNKMIDNYQILQPLGRGANGVVYKGLNVQTGSFVAMKQLHLGRAQIKVIKSQMNFLRELNHPNIVKYFAAIQKQSKIYLILQYIEEGSLANLARRSPFSQNLVKLYIKQVLQGLKYLHQQQIIHRDIKGANILLTKEGKVKLADFGVAVKISENQKTLSAAGTPYWMAPELIMQKAEATFTCDIWSLGCTVVQLLTGNPPYYNLLQIPALLRIVEDDHPPLPQNITSQCRTFLLKCFTKDNKKRPNASDLLTDPWIQTSAGYDQFRQKRKLDDLIIQQMLQQQEWDFEKLNQVIENAGTGKSIYRNPKFIRILQQINNPSKATFIYHIIKQDFTALRYLNMLGIEVNQDSSIRILELVQQIMRLCLQTGQVFIYVRECIPIIGKLISFAANSSNMPILNKLIQMIYLIALQECIDNGHFFYLLNKSQIIEYLLQIFSVHQDALDHDNMIMIMEILYKALASGLKEISSCFQSYLLAFIRIEYTQNKILCFHCLKILQSLAKNQLISELMEQQGALVYVIEFIRMIRKSQIKIDNQYLVIELLIYVQQLIMDDDNRILQFKRHGGLQQLSTLHQITKNAQLRQNIEGLIDRMDYSR